MEPTHPNCRYTDVRIAGDRCGIKHRFGDQTCARARSHFGLCRSRAYRAADGSISWSEWFSEGGVYKSHYRYHTIRPANAQRATR